MRPILKYYLLIFLIVVTPGFFSYLSAETSPKEIIESPIFSDEMPLSTIPTQESLINFPPKTQLSEKAITLSLDMSKKEVLNLLGKPTWAVTSEFEPLVWIWKNGFCNPVKVIFNDDMKVIGFDEGRAECLKKPYFTGIDDKYLCSHSDTKKLCK